MSSIKGQLKVTVESVYEGGAVLRISIDDEDGDELMTWEPYEVHTGHSVALSQVFLVPGASSSPGEMKVHVAIDPDQSETSTP